MEFHLTLTTEHVNTVMSALAERPFKEVSSVWAALDAQVRAQVEIANAPKAVAAKAPEVAA